MGIFSSKKTDNKNMAQNKRAVSDQINLVGEGTTFEGTLHAENDVRTSGHIVGTIRVEGRAIIAESGSVDGEVVATNADVAGRVQGEVRVSECLVLKSTARIEGDIHTKRLVVEEGALFTGSCSMEEIGASKDAEAASDTAPGQKKSTPTGEKSEDRGASSAPKKDKTKSAS